MMMSLACDVIKSLNGKTLSVAESCTGGMIGAALTAVPGSSSVFKGGVISYTNEIKSKILNVSAELLASEGAVSKPVAEAMAVGVRKLTASDYAVSVTGLAGPGADDFGNPVGTVYIGFACKDKTAVEKHLFAGDRQQIRDEAVKAALQMILKYIVEVNYESN